MVCLLNNINYLPILVEQEQWSSWPKLDENRELGHTKRMKELGLSRLKLVQLNCFGQVGIVITKEPKLVMVEGSRWCLFIYLSFLSYRFLINQVLQSLGKVYFMVEIHC